MRLGRISSKVFLDSCYTPPSNHPHELTTQPFEWLPLPHMQDGQRLRELSCSSDPLKLQRAMGLEMSELSTDYVDKNLPNEYIQSIPR